MLYIRMYSIMHSLCYSTTLDFDTYEASMLQVNHGDLDDIQFNVSVRESYDVSSVPTTPDTGEDIQVEVCIVGKANSISKPTTLQDSYIENQMGNNNGVLTGSTYTVGRDPGGAYVGSITTVSGGPHTECAQGPGVTGGGHDVLDDSVVAHLLYGCVTDHTGASNMVTIRKENVLNPNRFVNQRHACRFSPYHVLRQQSTSSDRKTHLQHGNGRLMRVLNLHKSETLKEYNHAVNIGYQTALSSTNSITPRFSYLLPPDMELGKGNIIQHSTAPGIHTANRTQTKPYQSKNKLMGIVYKGHNPEKLPQKTAMANGSNNKTVPQGEVSKRTAGGVDGECIVIGDVKGRKMLCLECGKGYTSRDSLVSHVKSVHQGEAFTCLCTKMYSWKSSLYKHMRTCKVMKDLYQM